MGYIGRGPVKSGAFRIIDSIASSFNGSTTGFTLQHNSSNITPGTEQNLLIAVDGVMQEPVDAFTISGSTITFTSAPASGASFWGVELGDVGGIASSVSNGAIDTAQLAADAIDGTKIEDNAINSEHYVDGSIDLAHMSANSIDSDQYVDGSIDLAHMSANSVDSDQYVDGSIDTVHIDDLQVTGAKIANDTITEAKLDVSNAPSNGQFLQAQSGEGGGLTWAAASGLRGIIVLNPQGIDNTSTGALGVVAPHPWVGCRPTGAGNDGSAYFTGSAPSDFTTLNSAKLVCLGVEGSTNVRLGNNVCKIASHSEINTTHSNTMSTANYAITTNEIMHIDISSLFTNLAANDSFAFNIRRNGSHGDDTVTTFYIYSAILEYS